MRKKVLALTLITLFSCSLMACGKKEEVVETTEAEVTTEAKTEEKTDEKYALSEKYESKDGWSVRYLPDSIQVNEADGTTSFVYTGECSGTDMVSISYLKDKNSKNYLLEKLGNDEEAKKNITEGTFIGYEDRWCYIAVLESDGADSGMSTTYLSSEYNGGTIFIEVINHAETDEEIGMAVSDTLSMIVDSLSLDDPQPQKELAFIPGEYKSYVDEEVDGKKTTKEYKITLKKDHTGTMEIQDKIDVTWSSDRITQAGTGNTYAFSVNGTELKINMGGMWFTFDKNAKATTEEEKTTEAKNDKKDSKKEDKKASKKESKKEKKNKKSKKDTTEAKKDEDTTEAKKEDTTETTEQSDDGQSALMNFIGKYGSGRCTIEVNTLEGQDGTAEIRVSWSGSANSYSEWKMTGKFDDDKLTVDYKDCVKKEITMKEDGSVDTENVIYENGTGTFTFKEGKNGLELTWDDKKESAADGMTFTYDSL